MKNTESVKAFAERIISQARAEIMSKPATKALSFSEVLNLAEERHKNSYKIKNFLR